MDAKTSVTPAQGALSDTEAEKPTHPANETETRQPEQVEPSFLHGLIYHVVAVPIFNTAGFGLLYLYQGAICVSRWQSYVITSSAIALTMVSWKVYCRRRKVIKDLASTIICGHTQRWLLK